MIAGGTSVAISSLANRSEADIGRLDLALTGSLEWSSCLSVQSTDIATIYGKNGSTNEPRSVRTEPCNGLSNFACLGNAILGRIATYRQFPQCRLVGQKGINHGGVGVPWTDDIDSYP